MSLGTEHVKSSSTRRKKASRKRSSTTKLSRAQILKVALRLVRDEGLEKLTMRRLAEELGVATMATYRHFKNRDELVIGMVDEVCRKRVGHTPPENATWQEQLTDQAQHALQTFSQYKGLPTYIIKHGPHTKYGLRVIETWLQILIKAGFDYEESVYVFQSICMQLASIVEFSTETDKAIWTYINVDKIDPEELDMLPLAKKSIRHFEHSRESIFEWQMKTLIVALEKKLADTKKPQKS
ncbi:MAG: TetR family transcriptional regulator [Pseudomonadota bacterium]